MVEKMLSLGSRRESFERCGGPAGEAGFDPGRGLKRSWSAEADE